MTTISIFVTSAFAILCFLGSVVFNALVSFLQAIVASIWTTCKIGVWSCIAAYLMYAVAEMITGSVSDAIEVIGLVIITFLMLLVMRIVLLFDVFVVIALSIVEGIIMVLDMLAEINEEKYANSMAKIMKYIDKC